MIKIALLTKSLSSGHLNEIISALNKNDIVFHAIIIDSSCDKKGKLFNLIVRKYNNRGVYGILKSIKNKINNSVFKKRGVSQSIKEVKLKAGLNNVEIIKIDFTNAEMVRGHLKNYAFDLFILAGCGIVKKGMLDIPKLGTINIHMGILPFFRGINVAEWAYFLGEPVGASVHFVDLGVDTGPILFTERIEIKGPKDIQELRATVNIAQLNLLIKAIKIIIKGPLFKGEVQDSSEGRQFFRMHSYLKNLLSKKMNVSN